jgi:hypothetical protein
MINARYDKVIVIEEMSERATTPGPDNPSKDFNGDIKAVVIFDEEKHVPVFWGIEKFGMDDVLELLGGHVVK